MEAVIGPLLAAAAGCAVAAVNYSLTRRAMAESGGMIGALSVVRMLLSVGLLAGIWFLAPHTPWDRTWMLVGAAAGLTLPMFFFTALLVRQADASGGKPHDPAGSGETIQDPEQDQGGDR